MQRATALAAFRYFANSGGRDSLPVGAAPAARGCEETPYASCGFATPTDKLSGLPQAVKTTGDFAVRPGRLPCHLALAWLLLAGAAWAAGPVPKPLHALDSAEGVKFSMRPKGADGKIEVVRGAANRTEGRGAIRFEGLSPASKGNKYFSISITLDEPVDLTRRRVLLDARTAQPDNTKAFYVRFYNRGETKPGWSFNSWDGQLQEAWRTFSFQARLSAEGLAWEASNVGDRVANRVDRIEVIIGTADDGKRVDASLDNIRTAAPLAAIADLEKPKTLLLDTVLVREGKPAATIVHPDTDAGRQAARAVADAVKSRAGVALPTRPATAADRDVEPTETLILLGNVDNNPALLLPYARYFTPVDSVCPGTGGHLVHTVHDPFGRGVNEVVLGASDDAGLAKAAETFAALLAKQKPGRNLSLPRMFERGYGEAFLKKYRWAGAAPSPKRFEEGLAAGRKAIEQGQHCSVAAVLQNAALRYQLTGHEVEAKLYVALWDLYAANAVAAPNNYGGPWGFDSDFPSAQVVCGWDVIEEDPALTDAERLRVTKTMARWLAEAVLPKVGNSLKHVPHNHQTFPGLGALMGGLYFSHGYDVVEGRKWLAAADNLFKPQAVRFKPLEDCNGYQWLTNGHQMRYAAARPDFTLLAGAAGRRVIDYCLGTMNNLGYQVPYGDTGSWQCWSSELACLDLFAYATGDPAATWAAALKRRTKSLLETYAFYRAGEGQRPTQFDGVKVWPLEPMYYQSQGAESRPPLERCFDKISFREAMEPAAAYLLLDGLSNGGHKHLDGNSIPQLTQFERIWLADNDYIKAQTKYHNTALVFQDGQATAIPEYVELLGAGQTERYGYSRTRVAGYSGADWDRTIVWLKSLKAFLVLDRMRATEPAEYQFRVLWQGVGEATPSPDGMLLRQKGPSLRIQTAPGPRTTVVADADLGSTWRGYPFADPITQTMTATATVRLKEGESYLYATVLHGDSAADAKPWRLEHLDGIEGVRIITEQGAIVAGLGPVKSAVPGVDLATDAQAWVADAEGVTLLHAAKASLGRVAIHRSHAPACVDVKTNAGRLLAAAGRSPTPNLEPDGKAPPQALVWSQGAAEGLTIARVVTAKLGGTAPAGLLVATEQGKLLALNADGSPRWTKSFDTALNDVAAADLDGDGKDEAIVGRKDYFVTAVDDDGRELWSKAIPFYRERPVVACVMAGDLDGDGKPEVVAGAYNWRFYAFRADGTQLWYYETVRKSLSGAVADLDGDGKAEVLCGTEYYSTTTLKGDGSRLWSYSFGPICHQVATGSFDGDKTRGAVYGGGDGFIHYVGADGKMRLRYQTGEEVRRVATGDLDGDGRDEFLAGSQNNSLYCFGGDAKLRWRRDLGADVTSLAAVRNLAVAGTAAGSLLTFDGAGNLVARSELSSRIVQIAPHDGCAVVATADGRLRRVTPRTTADGKN